MLSTNMDGITKEQGISTGLSYINELRTKSILLLGLNGKSAKSVLSFFSENGIKAVCGDEAEMSRISTENLNLMSKVCEEGNQFFSLNLDAPCPQLSSYSFDLIIIAPGLPLAKNYLQMMLAKGVPVFTEIELAYRIYPQPLIAITGTDGKSTTTSLTEFILRALGLQAKACGNIGLPYLDIAAKNLMISNSAKDENNTNLGHKKLSLMPGQTFPIVELSSYQLESVSSFQPVVGALLNIAEDHIDRYDDINGYITAKLNIFHQNISTPVLRLQDLEDYDVIKNFFIEKESLKKAVFFVGIFASQMEVSEKLNLQLLTIKRNFSGIQQTDLHFFYFIEDHFFIRQYSFAEKNEHRDIISSSAILWQLKNLKENFPLSGNHNWENLAFSLAIVYFFLFHFGKAHILDEAQGMINELKKFQGLAHRFEQIKNFQGIEIINDSKATTFQATIRAVKSLQGRSVILIAGGRGKGGDSSILGRELASNIKHLICIGEMAEEIKNSFLKEAFPGRVSMAKDLEEAVKIAKKNAASGDAVLFSPAFSSFDMFKNFEDRGHQFRKLVETIFC